MAKTKSQASRFLMAALIVSAVFVVLAGVVGFFLILPLDNEQPTVRILFPQENLKLFSGQGVKLIAEARARKGLSRIEFLVDDRLVGQRVIEEQNVSEQYVVFTWFSGATGIHKLSIQARDHQGRSSEVAFILVGVLANTTISMDWELVSEDAYGGTGTELESDAVDPLQTVSAGEEEESAWSEPQVGISPPMPLDVSLSDEEQGEADSPMITVIGVSLEELNALEQQMENIDPQEEDFPVPIAGQPQDAPPLAYLSANVRRDGEGNLIVDVDFGAQDDLGVEHIAYTYAMPDGSDISPRIPCNGLSNCPLENSHVLDTSGVYRIIVQAVDTSGQRSEIVAKRIQVMPQGQDGLIALVVEEDEEVAEGACQAEEVHQLDSDSFPPPVVNFDEMLDEVRDPEDCPLHPPPPGDDKEMISVDPPMGDIEIYAEDNGCLELYGWEVPEGLILKLVVLCNYKSPDGKEIQIEFERTSLTSDNFPLDIPLDSFAIPWNDRKILSLSKGDVFDVLDPTLKCWTRYTYRVGLSLVDQGRPIDNIFNPNLSQTDMKITSLPCGEDFTEGVEMMVEVRSERGYLITWQIPELAIWYAGPAPTLARSELQFFNVDGRYAGYVGSPGHISSFPYSGEFVDQRPWCGESFFYKLVLTNQDTGEVMAQVIKEAPERSCKPGSISEWDIAVDQYFEQDPQGYSHLITDVLVIMTSGWPYPDEWDLVLLQISPFDDVGRLSVTGDLRDHGERLHLTERIMECGTNYPYQFSLELVEDLSDLNWEGVWRSPTRDLSASVWVWPLPCLPWGPKDLVLFATMCEGQPCIQISWDQKRSSEGIRAYEADEIKLVRKVHGGNVEGQQIILLSPDQTSYTDMDVSPGVNYSYRVYYTFEDLYRDSTLAAIITPSGDNWNCFVDRPSEYQCGNNE
jgi:hypothetical protein